MRVNVGGGRVAVAGGEVIAVSAIVAVGVPVGMIVAVNIVEGTMVAVAGARLQALVVVRMAMMKTASRRLKGRFIASSCIEPDPLKNMLYK